MSNSTLSPRGSNAANHEFLNTVLFHYDYDDPELGTVKVPVTLGEYLASETERLKAEIQAAFLDYIRLRNVVNDCAFDVSFAQRFGTLEERVALEQRFEQERQQAIAAKRRILALTAPAGGAE